MDWLQERMRKIHLDFHTPPWVKVGRNFKREEFARYLRMANADTVVIFAKDHYGNAFYPSKLGNTHPGLDFDLFGSMLQSAHEENIKVFAYLSAVWDNFTAERHPEWRQVDAESRPLPAGYWQSLCLNSPYVEEWLLPQIREVLENYEVDGIWLDIVLFMEGGCFCPYCLEEIKKQGMDPHSPDHLLFNDLSLKRFMDKVYSLVKGIRSEVALTYNGIIKIGTRDFLPYLDLLEIESLPYGWGLYYLPLYGRYIRTLGKPFNGITARFQRSWGDFGSLKPTQVLLWEAGEMLTQGASVSIGDQMNPDGTLEQAVYETIGEVYEFVKERERWCKGARSVPYVGVIGERQLGTFGVGKPSQALLGATALLMEAHIHFDILDEEADFSPYALLILPDATHLSSRLQEKILQYVRKGGMVFLSLGPFPDETLLSLIGRGRVRLEEPNFSLGYVRVKDKRLSRGLPSLDMIVWEKPTLLKGVRGDALASLVAPMVERTPEHFFSHAQAPAGEDTGCPAVYLRALGRGKIMIFAFPLFTSYHKDNYFFHRQLFCNAFEMMVSRQKRLLEVEAPPQVEVSLMQRGKELVIHFLNLNINRKGNVSEIFTPIERGIFFRLLLPRPPKRVYYAPGEWDVPKWRWEESTRSKVGILRGRVRPFDTHIMVVVEMDSEDIFPIA